MVLSRQFSDGDFAERSMYLHASPQQFAPGELIGGKHGAYVADPYGDGGDPYDTLDFVRNYGPYIYDVEGGGEMDIDPHSDEDSDEYIGNPTAYTTSEPVRVRDFWVDTDYWEPGSHHEAHHSGARPAPPPWSPWPRESASPYPTSRLHRG